LVRDFCFWITHPFGANLTQMATVPGASRAVPVIFNGWVGDNTPE
jgi:hypothetical protein